MGGSSRRGDAWHSQGTLLPLRMSSPPRHERVTSGHGCPSDQHTREQYFLGNAGSGLAGCSSPSSGSGSRGSYPQLDHRGGGRKGCLAMQRPALWPIRCPRLTLCNPCTPQGCLGERLHSPMRSPTKPGPMFAVEVHVRSSALAICASHAHCAPRLSSGGLPHGRTPHRFSGSCWYCSGDSRHRPGASCGGEDLG